jgi:c-di-GMP-binding flagellar brake protein YcgR
MAENISMTGMLIRTARPAPEGETIQLKFTLPAGDKELRMKAVVQHVVPGEYMGLQFVDLDPQVQKAIQEFTESTSAGQPKGDQAS